MSVIVDKNLYAVSLMDGERERFFFLISPVPPKSSSDWGYGVTVIEITNRELIESLKAVGVNTKTPIKVTGFAASEVDSTERTVNLGIDSVIETEDKSFQNQYAMCKDCGHPISPNVEVTVNQRQVDSYNQGETINTESGRVIYRCRNCNGGRPQTFTVQKLSIYKGIGANYLK